MHCFYILWLHQCCQSADEDWAQQVLPLQPHRINPWACPCVSSEHCWSCCNSVRKKKQEYLTSTWICTVFNRNINFGISYWNKCVYVKAEEQLTERPLWIVRDAIPSKGGFTPAVQPRRPHTGENTAQAAPEQDPALTAGQSQEFHMPVLLSAQQAKGLTGRPAGRQQQ